MKLKSKPADFHSAYNPALFMFERDNTDSQSLCTMHLYIEEQDITLSKKFGKESQAILDVSGYLRNFFKEYKNDKFDEAYTTDHHHLMFEYAVQQPDTMVTRQSFTTFRGVAQTGQNSDWAKLPGKILTTFDRLTHYPGYPLDVTMFSTVPMQCKTDRDIAIDPGKLYHVTITGQIDQVVLADKRTTLLEDSQGQPITMHNNELIEITL